MTVYSLRALAEHLKIEIANAEADAKESHKIAMNSYGAGFDRGYVTALVFVLEEIPEEEKK